ncbi:MAG: haloacid dehalogenase-like hydrolase [Polyangiaceae bacterium]|nr:haloacid dehalogenase-like hydrolase [Polyangiaceae bacterium]
MADERGQAPLRALTVAELLRELERERASVTGPAMLACDCDGTLWRGDVGEAQLERLLAVGGVREAARDALLAEGRAAHLELDAAASPTALAAGLYAGYRGGRYRDADAFAMMAWVFAGYDAGELEAFADRTLDAFGLATALRQPLRAVLAWAEANDTEVWLVSASPAAIVTRAALRMGIAVERVVAVTPRVAGGVVEPGLAAPLSYGHGKIERLRAVRPAHELIAAFGDSAYDLELLAAARVPVAVAPGPALRARAAELPRMVELVEI